MNLRRDALWNLCRKLGKRSSKLLFFIKYAAIVLGVELLVSKKLKKRQLSLAEIVGVSTEMAALTAIILTLIR